PDVVVLIVNSNVERALASGEYAARRRQCEDAARALGLGSLRDATAEDLERYRSELGEHLLRRARHVVSEDARTLATAERLRKGVWDAVGRLMYQGHASRRDYFEVSCPELDLLVELAESLAHAGVLGARMTGGGFGGCTVSLVRRAGLGEVT